MNWNEIIDKINDDKKYEKLNNFIESEYKNKIIYPEKSKIFRALELTPLDEVRVVIIGQDPYATPGYACGLAFSVCDGVKIPKSLNNIYKEINTALGLKIPETGNLESWSKKGILLLNRILTVEKEQPLSHKNKGWEEFTLELIKILNLQEQKIVFLLFGKEAESLSKYLTNPNHLVLITSHPSPLGAYRGFFNSGVFKKTCEYLNAPKTLWEVER